MRFHDIAQGEQADGASAGVVELLERSFQVLDREGTIRPQLRDDCSVMRYRRGMAALAHTFRCFQSIQ
jgi:hypothetical protein